MQKILLNKIVLFLIASLLVAGLYSQALGHEVNKGAIVLLTCKGKTGERIGTGTGFIVKPEGVLITNYHVLVDAVSVNAVFSNGTQVPVQQVLKVDRIKDFAVLKLKDGFYSTLEIGNSRNTKAFDYSSALGYLTQSVSEDEGKVKGDLLQTFGFVLGVHPQAHPDFSYIYNTTTFGPGFSGGPVVDRENKVIGIATLEGRGINLALPIHEVQPFLDQKKGMAFEQLLQEDQDSKEALYYRGNFSLYGKSDPDQAILNFQKVLKKDPNFVLALYDLAAAKRDQGLIDETIADYEKIIRINPNFPEALSNLGGYYFRAGKLEKAVSMFEQAVQNYPNFTQALSNLGAALNKLNRAAEAVPHLQKTIRLDPEFAIAYYNLGNSFFSLNRLEEAQKTYGKSVELGLDFLSLHWKLFETNHRLGKNQKAKNELEIILQMDPENQKAQQELAKLPPTAVK
jgi:tetratricopeptide (TPR) repeat protein